MISVKSRAHKNLKVWDDNRDSERGEAQYENTVKIL